MSAKNPYEGLGFEKLQEEAGRALEATPKEDRKPREWGQLEKALEQKAETPSHSEIMDAYRGAGSRSRVHICERLALNGLMGAEIDTLDQAHQIEGFPIAFDPNPEIGKPDVYFRQIAPIGPDGKAHRSDEVLVVIRLNESADKENNTVVVMVVKHEMGRPLIGKGPNGQPYPNQNSYLTSQQGYENLVAGSPEEPGKEAPAESLKKMLSGDMTKDTYLAAFTRENSQMSLDQYWAGWDKERDNDPDYWRSNRAKGEFMHRIEGHYQNLLQNFRKETGDIVEQTNLARERLVKEREDFVAELAPFISMLQEKRVRIEDKRRAYEAGEYRTMLDILAQQARARGIKFDKAEDLL